MDQQLQEINRLRGVVRADQELITILVKALNLAYEYVNAPLNHPDTVQIEHALKQAAER